MQTRDIQTNQEKQSQCNEIEILHLHHLHIPHTGGRVLNGYLWRNPQILAYNSEDDKTQVIIQYFKIHNANDIHKHKSINNDDNTKILKYFVLRDPIIRAYKEYAHYNRNLKNIGRVNHLELSDIQKRCQAEGKEYHLDSLDDYFMLEVNRNVLCKFLLGRTDFSIPITDSDCQLCMNLLLNEKYIYDLFDETMMMSYPKFFEMLQKYRQIDVHDIQRGLDTFKTLVDKHPHVLPNVTIEYLKVIHSYDIAIYQFLINRS
jgi:hypothetical protein